MMRKSPQEQENVEAEEDSWDNSQGGAWEAGRWRLIRIEWLDLGWRRNTSVIATEGTQVKAAQIQVCVWVWGWENKGVPLWWLLFPPWSCRQGHLLRGLGRLRGSGLQRRSGTALWRLRMHPEQWKLLGLLVGWRVALRNGNQNPDQGCSAMLTFLEKAQLTLCAWFSYTLCSWAEVCWTVAPKRYVYVLNPRNCESDLIWEKGLPRRN